MDLVQNYLNTVRPLLPPEQRDDIVRELSAEIETQIEEEAAPLGRPLDDTEVKKILARHGPPLLLASRYGSQDSTRSFCFGRQWVGPLLFPFYRKVLLFNVALSTVVMVVVALAVGLSAGRLLNNFFLQLFLQFAIVTAIFALVEKHLSGTAFSSGNTEEPPTETALRVSRLNSLAELVATGIFLGWICTMQWSPELLFGGRESAAFFATWPSWAQVFPMVLVLGAVGMVRSCINLWRPEWVRFRFWMRIATDAIGLALVIWLLNLGTWIVPTVDIETTAAKFGMINKWFLYGLLATALVIVVSLVQNITALMRVQRELKGENAR